MDVDVDVDDYAVVESLKEKSRIEANASHSHRVECALRTARKVSVYIRIPIIEVLVE